MRVLAVAGVVTRLGLMIVMTGNWSDIAEACGRRLVDIAVVVFQDELRRVLKVGSGVPLLIMFLGVSFPLCSVIKFGAKYFGVDDLINFVFCFIVDSDRRWRRISLAWYRG